MHIYICIHVYIYIQMQYFILHDLEIITRKTSRTCAAQVKFIKHCKTWKHHVQSQRGSHLAVQLPDCRSAAVWRSSQSGLRGRNSALGSSQALRRWWNKVDFDASTTHFCWRWAFSCHPCKKRYLGQSSGNWLVAEQCASGKWCSMSQCWRTSQDSANAPGWTWMK